MGACCSSCCPWLFGDASGSPSSGRESEMVSSNSKSNGGASGGAVLGIDRSMSAPTIRVEDGDEHGALLEVTGVGLALAGCSVEQDSAYWEWHVERIPCSSSRGGASTEEKAGDDFEDGGAGVGERREEEEEEGEEIFDDVKFGVSTRKSPEYFAALSANEEGDDVSIQEEQTALMRSIPNLSDGDTVGVAVQQSDLPMIQFLLNGEPLHELAINRFRGTVFPAAFLVEGVRVTAAFDESRFREDPPHSRFGPLIAARSIV